VKLPVNKPVAAVMMSFRLPGFAGTKAVFAVPTVKGWLNSATPP